MLNHPIGKTSCQPASNSVTQKECVPIDHKRSEKQGTRGIWKSLSTINITVLYKLASSPFLKFQIPPKAMAPESWKDLGILKKINTDYWLLPSHILIELRWNKAWALGFFKALR